MRSHSAITIWNYSIIQGWWLVSENWLLDFTSAMSPCIDATHDTAEIGSSVTLRCEKSRCLRATHWADSSRPENDTALFSLG